MTGIEPARSPGRLWQARPAIAQELVVAIGSVKRHVGNILSKLQVESRLGAVARARDLGLT